jgi:apoptosis-stimulating of p53 protein 1
LCFNVIIRSSSTHIYPPQKNVRGNVAAVEPYNHTPQKSTSTSNQQQHQQQIIQDLAMLKLKSSHQQQQQQQQHSPTSNMAAESDETKLARQKQFNDHITPQQTQGLLTKNTSNNNNNNNVQNHQVKDSIIMDNGNEKQTSAQSTDLNGKKSELTNQTMPYNKFVANNSLNVGNSSLLSHKIISSVLSANNGSSTAALAMKSNECDSEKAGEITGSNDMSTGHVNGTQIASSTPLNAINKSVAEPLNVATTTETEEKPAIKPKALHQIPSGNLVVPPRKPISSVAPTSIKSISSQAPKVHMVAPNVNVQASSIENDKSRPALPPKPNKNGNNNNVNNNSNNNSNSNSSSSNQQVLSNESENASVNNENNNLPIKAKPLTIKKQPLSEQPKLRSLTSNLKTIQFSTSRRIEMPPSFLFPEIATTELKDNSNNGDVNGNSMNQTSIISKLVNGNINLSHNLNSNSNNNNNSQDSGSITSTDETDKSITPVSTPIQSEEKHVDSIVKRKRNIIGDNVKAKLARRVSFDPLALLLDASLEGELELVRKTAMQVPNPSAANDEGITALHNAICAGHLEIVK